MRGERLRPYIEEVGRMHSKQWIRVDAGRLKLTTWVGDSQVAYRAKWDIEGWVLTRHVFGAATTLRLAHGLRDFRAVQALVDDDARLGL